MASHESGNFVPSSLPRLTLHREANRISAGVEYGRQTPLHRQTPPEAAPTVGSENWVGCGLASPGSCSAWEGLLTITQPKHRDWPFGTAKSHSPVRCRPDKSQLSRFPGLRPFGPNPASAPRTAPPPAFGFLAAERAPAAGRCDGRIGNSGRLGDRYEQGFRLKLPLPSHILRLLFSVRGTAEGKLCQTSRRDAALAAVRAVGRAPASSSELPAGTTGVCDSTGGPVCSRAVQIFLPLAHLCSPPHVLVPERGRSLTHTPDILIPETLERGRPGNLTCSVPWACEQGTPPIFSWTSAALTALGPRTHLSSVLTLTPRPQDHGTNLACQVYFPAAGVTVERTSQLDVTYAPQNTAIRIFHGNRTALGTLQNTSSILIREGQALRLRCTADSNPPAELSWFWGSPTLNATPICKSPILDLPQVGAEEEGDLTCQAQNSLGSQHVSLHLSVVYALWLLPPSCSWEGEGLHCNCSSRARPAPTLRWQLGEGLLEGNHSNASWTVTSSSAGPWANSSLSLSGPLVSGLRLSCEAGNAHGSQSAAILLLPGKPEPRASGVLGAVGGAGIMALLSLCLCLVFRVKTCRKKAVKPVRSLNLNLAGSAGSGAHQQQSWMDIPAGHPAPAEASPVSGENQELHYAFLRFPKLKPHEQQGINTEYSEIKIHK
ncbi:sialic acid-binding Ig-like lectin 5 isoform X1 [Ursus arctos]|uniref:sialic acid-binding Ig-like lectin 5 isoform X1 n=1 Tax=Ursus arctos TaxID=9644 RepID=UPI002016BB9B|nr:sialic acid-binding Ig-like lectin 5 isoform X1 [Ursus arctos]